MESINIFEFFDSGLISAETIETLNRIMRKIQNAKQRELDLLSQWAFKYRNPHQLTKNLSQPYEIPGWQTPQPRRRALARLTLFYSRSRSLDSVRSNSDFYMHRPLSNNSYSPPTLYISPVTSIISSSNSNSNDNALSSNFSSTELSNSPPELIPFGDSISSSPILDATSSSSSVYFCKYSIFPSIHNSGFSGDFAHRPSLKPGPSEYVAPCTSSQSNYSEFESNLPLNSSPEKNLELHSPSNLEFNQNGQIVVAPGEFKVNLPCNPIHEKNLELHAPFELEFNQNGQIVVTPGEFEVNVPRKSIHEKNLESHSPSDLEFNEDRQIVVAPIKFEFNLLINLNREINLELHSYLFASSILKSKFEYPPHHIDIYAPMPHTCFTCQGYIICSNDKEKDEVKFSFTESVIYRDEKKQELGRCVCDFTKQIHFCYRYGVFVFCKRNSLPNLFRMSSSQNGEINNTSSGDRFFTIIDNNDIDQDNEKLFSPYSGSNSSNSQDSDRPLLYVNAASNDDSGKPASSYDETISSASKDENGLSIDKLIRECRITSDGSSVFEDLPFCDAHGHVKDLFCGDCMTEICVDCVKHFHNSHSLYPGLSCKDMIQETERARIIVKDNIDTIEKNISNLQIKRVLISGRVKSFFRHYRQIVNEKEAELLNRIDYTLDYRLNILNEKLKENQIVMNANLRLMNLIAEHLKNHDMESVMRDGAYAKKHLEVLRSLPNTWIPSDENINFVPPENPAIIPLNEIDFSGPCSIVTPISDSNRLKGKSRFDNVMNTAFNKTEENFYQHFGPTSVSPTPYLNQPSFFDDKPTNFVSVGTSQTTNKGTIGGLAPGGRNFMSVNESPSAVEPSSNRFGFNRSLSTPNYVNNDDFFNFSNPMQNFNFNEPVILNRIAYDSNAGFLNAINDVGAFPVSFHTRRNYARIKKPVLVFGQEGSGDNDLCRPWGVCCDRQGHIIVADRSNNRISIFRTDGSHVRCFGKLGSEEGEFSRPAGVAIDYFGRIVIADKDNHRVQVMTMEGEFVFAFGERGAHNGKFHYPWDVDVNSVGSIIVSDTRNHRIQLFSGNGMFLKKFGYENLSTMWKYFDSPRGVCFLTEHIILVTDFNNHKLFEIDMEKNPKIVNVDNFKRCEFFRPQGVAVDADGNVLVADCRNHRIQVFTRQGEILGAFGVNGKELGQFDRPSGIALTPDGKIVVVDFGNHRIQVF